jgi:hypothetical protein
MMVAAIETALERVAASTNLFLDGLLGDERRKTGRSDAYPPWEWGSQGNKRTPPPFVSSDVETQVALRCLDFARHERERRKFTAKGLSCGSCYSGHLG